MGEGVMGRAWTLAHVGVAEARRSSNASGRMGPICMLLATTYPTARAAPITTRKSSPYSGLLRLNRDPLRRTFRRHVAAGLHGYL